MASSEKYPRVFAGPGEECLPTASMLLGGGRKQGAGFYSYGRQIRDLEWHLTSQLEALKLLEEERQELRRRHSALEQQLSVSGQHLLCVAQVCCGDTTSRGTSKTPSVSADEQGGDLVPGATAGDAPQATAIGDPHPPGAACGNSSPDPADTLCSSSSCCSTEPRLAASVARECDVLRVVMQREEELRALLSSSGIVLPRSNAAARLRGVLQDGCVQTARAMTFEALAHMCREFVRRAALLLHILDSPQGAPAVAAQLEALVEVHLRKLMMLSVVQPLLIWRLASIDLETMEPADMPDEMYRYVLAHMGLEWENLEGIAAAYKAQEEVLLRLGEQEAGFSRQLAAASATSDSAAEAETLLQLERTMHHFTAAQSICASQMCAMSHWRTTARLLVLSYPFSPLAIRLGKNALEVVEEVKLASAAGVGAGQPWPLASSSCGASDWASVCCPPTLKAKLQAANSSSLSRSSGETSEWGSSGRREGAAALEAIADGGAEEVSCQGQSNSSGSHRQHVLAAAAAVASLTGSRPRKGGGVPCLVGQ